MTGIRRGLLIAGLLAGCGPGTGGVKGGGTGPTCPARDDVRAAMQEGKLSAALARVLELRSECPGVATARLLAEILGELGHDDRALQVWKEVAAEGGRDDQAAAERAIAELRRRPPPVKKDVPDADRQLALALYRQGVDLRLAGKPREALAALRRSYVLSPHPLTIVQIGLAHRTAGSDLEARKSFERAMAIAEGITGTRAVGKLLRGHADSVYAVDWSNDGRLVASASGDGTVKLWDPIARRELRTIEGFLTFVGSIAISPDGSTVAAGGDKGGLRTIEVRDGGAVRMFDTDDAGTEVAFSPDGRLLASGYRTSKALVLWDVATAERVRVIGDETRGTGAVASIAFSPDGTLVASGDDDGVTVADVATGVAKLRLTDAGRQWVHALAFSPDGKLLASGGDKDIKLWAVDTGRVVREWRAHDHLVQGLEFSPEGARLVSVGDDVKVWRLADGQLLHRLAHDKAYVVAVRPRDGTIVSGGGDGLLKLWDLDNGSAIGTLGGDAGGVQSVAFIPGHELLVSGDDDGHVRQWDLGTGAAPTDLLPSPGREIARLEPSADGRALLVVDTKVLKETRISVWDVVARRQLFALQSQAVGRLDLDAATLSADGQTFAAGDFLNYNRHVALWDVGGKAPRVTFQAHGSAYQALALSPDGTLVATGDGVGTMFLVDTATGATRELAAHQRVASVVFSPDGKLLCSAGSRPDVAIIWDVASGKRLRDLVGHTSSISRAVFSPDGKRLATAAWDNTVRLWDPATGAAGPLLSGHGGPVRGIAFSRDGRTLVSASDDRTMMLWDAASGAALATVFVTRDGQWLVIGADGRVDGSAGAEGGMSFLSWKSGAYELPGFAGWERAQTPGLLAQIVARR